MSVILAKSILADRAPGRSRTFDTVHTTDLSRLLDNVACKKYHILRPFTNTQKISLRISNLPSDRSRSFHCLKRPFATSLLRVSTVSVLLELCGTAST